jgi:hypothetical protein
MKEFYKSLEFKIFSINLAVVLLFLVLITVVSLFSSVNLDWKDLGVATLFLISPSIVYMPTIVYSIFIHIRGDVLNNMFYQKMQIVNIVFGLLLFIILSASYKKNYYSEDMDKGDFIISRIR